MTNHAHWVWLALLAAGTSTAATVHQVDIYDYYFSPQTVSIQAGDTVHWVNHMGDHTVTADNGTFGSGDIRPPPWTFDQIFNSAGEFHYYCQNHSGPGLPISPYYMNGKVVVQAAVPPPFAINQGISGSWYNPLTSGQGVLFDIRPSDNFLFAAWFTYEKSMTMTGQAEPKVGADDQRWLTIQGNYSGNQAMNTPIYLTTGGLFDAVQHATTTQVGTATITFTSCTTGTIAYNLTNESLTGTIPIQRLIPGTETICQTLAAAPATAAQNADTPAQ